MPCSHTYTAIGKTKRTRTQSNNYFIYNTCTGITLLVKATASTGLLGGMPVSYRRLQKVPFLNPDAGAGVLMLSHELCFAFNEMKKKFAKWVTIGYYD